MGTLVVCPVRRVKLFTKSNRSQVLASGEQAPNSAARKIKKVAPQGGPSLGLGRALPEKQYTNTALGRIQSFDEGGPVEQDENARVHEGEYVLPADDPRNPLNQDQLVAENKAPSAFGSVTPVTDKPRFQMKPSAQPSTSDFVPTTIEPRDTSKESATGIPRVPSDQAAGDDAFKVALQNHADLVQRNNVKNEAAKKGDLVTLGSAIIADRHVPTSTFDWAGEITPREVPSGAVQPREFHQNTAGGPLVSGAPTDDKGTQRDFAKMEFKARSQQYDKAIQDAYDRGDERTAHEQELAKRKFQDQNPWGSAGNHPGILGKVAHGLATAGNIAGDVFAPATMALIPGTDLNRRVKEGGLGSAINRDVESELHQAEAHKALGEDWEKSEPIYDTNPASDTYGQAIGQSFYNKANPSQTRDVMFGQTAATATPQGKAAGTAGNAPTPSYGKPQALSTPLAAQQIDQTNQQAADLYRQLNPDAKEVPNEWQLPKNSTEKQLENFSKMLDKQIDTQNKRAQQAQNEQDKKDSLALRKQLLEMQRQANQLATEQKNAKPAIGIDANGQRVGGSFGDLMKTAGVKNIELDAKSADDVTYRNMAKMVTDTRDYLRTLPKATDDDLTALNRIAADFSLHAFGTSVGGDYFNKMFNSEIYKDWEKRADKGDTSAKAAIQLANIYKMLSEDSIAYLTSVQQVKGMRGTGLIDKIEQAYITPSKNRNGNLDAADRFLTTLHAAEHGLTLQPTDTPIDWSLK
jgi:hypothetical protein